MNKVDEDADTVGDKDEENSLLGILGDGVRNNTVDDDTDNTVGDSLDR